MNNKAYITILGRSTWALINTYYAVLSEKSYYPDLVYIFAENVYAEELKKAVKGVEILSEEYGFKPKIEQETIKEADFVEAGLKINALIKELKQKGCSIAIDITPGRKALVAGALLPAGKIGVDHIFYLAMKSLKNVAKPYKMISPQIQDLKDFMIDIKTYRREAENG